MPAATIKPATWAGALQHPPLTLQPSTVSKAPIARAMPQLAWTAKVHQNSILRLRPLIASSLDLELQRRQCRDGYLLLREVGVPRHSQTEAVLVTLHWKDSRSSLCHINVSSEEQDHPESTRCWDVAVRLRRLLRPTDP
jgi:hypothetical protein